MSTLGEMSRVGRLGIGKFNFDVLQPCSLPERVATGCREFFSELGEEGLTPVLYCGTRAAQGIDHMLICKSKMGSVEGLSKIIINELPEKNVWTISCIEQIA